MRNPSAFLIIPAVILVLSAAVSQTPPPSTGSAADSTIVAETPFETTLLLATNAARADAEVATLRVDEGLAQAARAHALEMAELNYFSHASPIPAHATLRQRVAAAGSPLVTLGENLALIGGDQEVVRRTLDGWLASPGHRANLLNPIFNQVGFGTAVTQQGETVIVQVLGYSPRKLLATGVRRLVEVRREVTVTIRSQENLTAAFSVAGRTDPPLDLGIGVQQVRLSTTAGGVLQVRAGVRLPGGNSFVLEDAGWLDTDSGSWQPDPDTPRDTLMILGASSIRRREELIEVTLSYDRGSGTALAAFLNGDHQPEAVIGDAEVRFLVPADTPSATLAVGEVVAGNQARIFHSFTLELLAGEPRLTASPR